MLGIKRTDRVPNETIYAITDTKPLIRTTIYRQLQFLGHILRMDDLEPSKIYAMYEPPHGKRPQGSQRKLYAQQAKVWIDPTGNFSESDILRTAQDRINWKRLVVDCSAVERWWWWWIPRNAKPNRPKASPSKLGDNTKASNLLKKLA